MGGRVAEHIEGREEDHILRQLVGAGALAHRPCGVGGIGGLGAVDHGSLGVVHRSGEHAGKGYGDIVERLVVLLDGAPLGLLLSVDTLKVDDIGIGAVESGGLVGAVEVDEQVVLGGHLGGTVVEVYDARVVAVDEVDLEALDSHLRVVLAHALHVLVEGIVAGPEDHADALGLAIVYDSLDVYARHDGEEVVAAALGPSLVEEDVLYAVAVGKVDVVLIGFGVDTGPKVYLVYSPVVPPVPSHLAGAYP